jgi:hypothetical protein
VFRVDCRLSRQNRIFGEIISGLGVIGPQWDRRRGSKRMTSQTLLTIELSRALGRSE